MVTDYKCPEGRVEERLEYIERDTAAGGAEFQWKKEPEETPPKLEEVLATDGIRVKEAWKNFDGEWMRVNERWERVFGTQVRMWSEKPKPPKGVL